MRALAEDDPLLMAAIQLELQLYIITQDMFPGDIDTRAQIQESIKAFKKSNVNFADFEPSPVMFKTVRLFGHFVYYGLILCVALGYPCFFNIP